MGRGRVAMLAGPVLALTAAGCGGSEFAPAAEPAVSPPTARPPAGHTFAVGAEPEGLALGRRGKAAVVTRDPARLDLLDLDRRRIVARVPLPSTARHLTVGAGQVVLVPAEQSDVLVEVDLASGEQNSIAVGDHPHDAASAAGKTYVGNEFGDEVSILDRGEVVDTVPAPAQPGGVALARGRLVVVAVAERVLAVYDTETLQRVATLAAGAGPTHVVAAGDRAWVVDTEGDALLSFALRPTPRLVATTRAPGAPYGIALDRRRMRLWLTSTAHNVAVVYDVGRERPRPLARYATVRQPNSIAVDERDGSAVVAGRAAGVLQLIRGPR